MTAKIVFQGNYSDLKFIRTRGVCQIVVEIPLEDGQRFVAAFGAPSPANEVPVAIARLQGPTAGDPTDARWGAEDREWVENANKRYTETPALEASSAGQGPSARLEPQQTAPTLVETVAELRAFTATLPPDQRPRRAWADLSYAEQSGIRCTEPRFIKFVQERHPDVQGTNAAVAYVRMYCNVASRADIKPGTRAETHWLDLERAYQEWRNKSVGSS